MKLEIFADAVSASNSSILIGDLAKLPTSERRRYRTKRLFEQLRNEGYLMKTGSNRNMPKQKYVANGFSDQRLWFPIRTAACGWLKLQRWPEKASNFLNKYLKNKEAVWARRTGEYIEALDGITYPQWVKLRTGIDMQFDFSEESWKKICRSLRRNSTTYPFGFWRCKL